MASNILSSLAKRKQYPDPMTNESRRSGCPIAISLDLFGDRWSLLIVRDLLFKKLRTFSQFAAAGEGIASNVLSDRLARLETAGIIEQHRDPDDGRRVIYRLTEKGLALAPALIEIVVWAARYENTDAPPALVKEMTTNRRGVLTRLRREWRAEQGKGRKEH